MAFGVWENGSHTMRTELVLYKSIVRITIGAPGEKDRGIGFDQPHAPRAMSAAMTPEQALRAAGAEGGGP